MTNFIIFRIKFYNMNEWMNEWMNLCFGPCRPLSMSSRYFLFLLSSSRSKANQQRSLVPFRLLQNLWHRGLQNVLLENIPCFSILRESLNGRLFHGYLRTSSGFWRRQLKSNIGFLVLTNKLPIFTSFRPKAQIQHISNL